MCFERSVLILVWIFLKLRPSLRRGRGRLAVFVDLIFAGLVFVGFVLDDFEPADCAAEDLELVFAMLKPFDALFRWEGGC